MAEDRGQMTEVRGQMSDDKGKKVRCWEGVKVRETSNLNSYYNLPLTFCLLPIFNINSINTIN